MTKNHELRNTKREAIERLEIHRDTVIDFIAVWGPLCAPLVPAGLTAAAIIVSFPDLLGIAVWGAWLIAVITVIALEVLGIVSVETWLDMRRYNAENADADEQAPVGQAVSVVVIYAVVVLSLVFVLKIWHSAALYSLVPLTMLGLITSWTIVLRKQHNQRKWDAERGNYFDNMQTELDKFRAMYESAHIESDEANYRYDQLQSRFDDIQTQYDESIARYDDLRRQYDQLQKSSELMRNEFDTLRMQYDEAKADATAVRNELKRIRKEYDLSAVLSELSDSQRDNLLQIIELVKQHRVTGPSDLLSLSELGKGTVYNTWQVALASRAVYKNGDGAYHVRG